MTELVVTDCYVDRWPTITPPTVITFGAHDLDGRRVVFGVDHRPARDLIAALDAGEEPHVEVDDWQIIARERP